MAAPDARNVIFQPPSSIEVMPCAYLLDIDGANLHVSNVDRFADGQRIRILPNGINGPVSYLQLAASNAVDRVNKILTLTGSPAASAGANEVQTLTGSASVAGTYALGWNGYFTADLAAAANAATIQAALRTIPGLEDVTATGGPLNTTTPLVVTFLGTQAKKDVELIVVNNTGLSAGSIAVVETTPGAPASIIPSVGSDILGPTLLTIGGTTEGLTYREVPATQDIEFDQVEGMVGTVFTSWSVEISTRLLEWKLDEIGFLTQNGYSTRAAGSGVTGAKIMDELQVCSSPFGLLVTFEKQDCADVAAGLKDYLLIYRAINTAGFDTVFSKTAPRGTPLTFRGYADPSRPRGKRFRRIVSEFQIAT